MGFLCKSQVQCKSCSSQNTEIQWDHPIIDHIEKKVTASSELILTWQTLTDFGVHPRDYREGPRVWIMLRPSSVPSPSFALNRAKCSTEMCAWCDTSKEENRMKNPSATHAQIISWTVWRQSNSETETANHCNQGPICTHFTNLLPVSSSFFTLLVRC